MAVAYALFQLGAEQVFSVQLLLCWPLIWRKGLQWEISNGCTQKAGGVNGRNAMTCKRGVHTHKEVYTHTEICHPELRLKSSKKPL